MLAFVVVIPSDSRAGEGPLRGVHLRPGAFGQKHAVPPLRPTRRRLDRGRGGRNGRSGKKLKIFFADTVNIV